MNGRLWFADHETGDLSQWYAPSTHPDGKHGGGVQNSGISDSVASKDHAHSGSWSVKMTITTPNPRTSGTRLFRWLESQRYPELYYSVWYYFPQRYLVPRYWNVFQWKSKRATTGAVDPFFILNVGNRRDGTMYFYLYNWQTKKTYTQPLKNIPVGEWVQVEAYHSCRADNTGHVTFWQNGVVLFDIPNVQTKYADGDCQWSVDNYSDDLIPATATIYTDDAAINTARMAR